MKGKHLNSLWMIVLLFLSCTKEEAPLNDFAILQFKSFDFKVETVAQTSDEGYVMQHAKGVSKIKDDGELVWEIEIVDIPGLPEKFRPSQVIRFGNKFWLLGSHTSESEILLYLICITEKGEIEWKKVHQITNEYSEPARITIHPDLFLNYKFNNYARAFEDADGTVKLIFSYDINNELARYRLFNFDEYGEILNERDYSSFDARCRVFSYQQLSDGRLIALMGVNDRSEIWFFNSRLDTTGFLEYRGKSRPTITNVVEIDGGLFVTGHDEYANNEIVNSNYDLLLLHINSKVLLDSSSYGHIENRELSATSLAGGEGKLLILANRRADYDFAHDKESDLLLIEYEPQTGKYFENILIENHGMEGIYAELNAGVLTVIGYKTGFTAGDEAHSFFTSFKYN